MPAIKNVRQIRFDQELQRHKRRVEEVLLGRPGMKGMLDQFREEADGEVEFFHQLAAAAESTHAELDAPNSGLVYVARSLDTIIGAHGRCLRHLYDEALNSAGCSSTEFAARLTENGLVIRGRAYKPAEWRELNLTTVLDYLTRDLDHYLGSEHVETTFAKDQPHTAFEFARAIGPLHPEL